MHQRELAKETGEQKRWLTKTRHGHARGTTDVRGLTLAGHERASINAQAVLPSSSSAYITANTFAGQVSMV